MALEERMAKIIVQDNHIKSRSCIKQKKSMYTEKKSRIYPILCHEIKIILMASRGKAFIIYIK